MNRGRPFLDLDTEILQSVEQDDMVAIRWSSHGTHTGSFMGVLSTERTVTVVGASFCRFVDGLLAEEWVVWDPGTPHRHEHLEGGLDE